MFPGHASAARRRLQETKVLCFCLSRKKTLSSGFTLLETLIALIIIAIGFAYAFAALPTDLAAQSHARHLETAASLAQSALAAGSDGAERGYTWRIERLPPPGLPTTPGSFSGQLLRVTVTWQEAGRTRSIGAETLRLGLLPPS